MHVTSVALAGTGLMYIFGAFYEGIHARHTAEKWLHPEKDASKFVSIDEFALVENLRIIAFLAVVIGASLIGLAKKGCKASWKKNVKFTNVTYKRSLVRFAFILVLSLIVRHYWIDSTNIKVQHIQKQAKAAIAANQTDAKVETTQLFKVERKAKKHQQKSESSKEAFERYVRNVLE
jgi:hypothetical protein